MIWDCVPYWREARLVAARVALWDRSGLDVTVVAFVGDRTHRGDPKPEGLPPPPDGVRTVNVTLDKSDDWGRERQQRDAVCNLRPEMADTDLILLCDADEIVNPAAIPSIMTAAENCPHRLSMVMYLFDTEWRTVNPWKKARACLARDLPAMPSQRLRGRSMLPSVADAGWHLTYQDDNDGKLRAFAHAEFDTDDHRAWLTVCRLNHTDLSGVSLIYDPLTGPLAEVL